MPEIIVKLGDNIVQKYFFVKESMSIGRTDDNQIVIENLAVSRNHAQIDFDDGQYTIEDLGSSNGTFVNGVRVAKTEILNRDVISIGKYKLYYYNQHAENGVRRPVLEAGDRTMMMDMTPIPQLTVTKGRQKGLTFDLNRMPCTIGRGSANLLRINDWFVSKQHAVIEQQGDDYVIRDLDSWRNTRINGDIITQTLLKPGDEIQLGPTVQISFAYPENALEADPALRHPVEIMASADPGPGSDEETAQAFSEEPRTEAADVELTLEPPAQGDDLDAAILAEALGNEAHETNGTCPASEDSPDATEEGPSAIEQVLQAVIKLEVAEAVWENSCPELQNLESFTGSEPDDSFGCENGPSPCEAVPVAVAVSTDPQADSEIAIWEKALENKSPVIRKQAARQLKKLTGRDYDY